MKRLQQLRFRMLLIAGTAAFAMITPRASAANVIVHIDVGAPARVLYHYVYYPDEEVYFVPETRVYWWAEAGEWHSGPHVPDFIVLGAGVNLDVDARNPWRHHEVIIARFPGHKHHDRDRDERRDRDDKHRP